MAPARRLLTPLGVILCVLTFGAAQAPVGPDLSGCWSGRWSNCNNTHTGPLHATFCKCEGDSYRVNFHGRFFKLIPFRYSVVLNVTKREADKVYLAGESNLGKLFGTFTYTAEATNDHFDAHYSSCKYQGTFDLKRCCP